MNCLYLSLCLSTQKELTGLHLENLKYFTLTRKGSNSYFKMAPLTNICLIYKIIFIQHQEPHQTLKLSTNSSRPEMFCKKGVLRNFAKFTGKHLCQSLFFNKVTGLRPVTLLKKRLLHRRFPANFAKF